MGNAPIIDKTRQDKTRQDKTRQDKTTCCLEYDDFHIGQEAVFIRCITEDMMTSFRELSGDTNPLHTDEDFARTKGYVSRVVYGMLTASLYSCLAGVYLPGRNCLLHSVHADFLRPVFVGDVLTVSGQVAEKRDTFRQLIIRAVIRNQDGVKVSRAKIEAGVL